MIKKAQLSFICITMSILFTVFGIIFVVAHFVLHNMTESNIDQTLTTAKDDYFLYGNDVVFEDGIISLITFNPLTNSYTYNYIFDKETFTEDTVKEIIDTAIFRPYYSGKINNVYYKAFALDATQTKYILVAAEMSGAIAEFEQILLELFFVLTGIFLILFYIVYRLSFAIFKPIKESLVKQKQFISNASHELKTPLSIISANADVLKQSGEDNQWLSNIRSQTDRMGVLVSDMLTLAKMDEGNTKRSRTEFNLSEEVINSALPFDAVAFEKGKTLDLDVSDDIMVTGEKESAKQIISILLDNAIKHASENGEIKVSLKKENGRIALTVFNTGSLVPAEDSNKIFERFYRGDKSRSRESGGSGLGLAIARGIADANKWKISAESEYGVSMTITVVFK